MCSPPTGRFCRTERSSRYRPFPRSFLPKACATPCLGFKAQNDAISEALRSRRLGWRHSGFFVHHQVRVPAEDPEGRKKLAGYMLRAPIALEKMTYDDGTGTVIYRSKMHLGLKRNFQVMPGAEWLELLVRHIPDRYEHLVRLRRRVFESGAGRAGEGSEEPKYAADAHRTGRTGQRVRRARQDRLGATHRQGV